MGLAQVKKELLSLPRVELLELRRHIDALVQLGGSEQDEPQEQDWITAGIWTELSRRGLVEQKYSPTRIKAIKPKEYDVRRAGVQELLLSRVGRELNYQERVALGWLVGFALAKYLDWHDHFGLKVMLNNIISVPEAVEASLPGYLECGMLGELIQDKR